MAEHLKVLDYHEDPMKLHRFIRWIQMPIAFVAMATVIVLHWEDYADGSITMISEAALCIFGMLLTAVTEFGFIYNASYSYFSVMLYYLNNVGIGVYYFIYCYKYTMVSNAVIYALGASCLATVVIFVLIYFYYQQRKYLFIESKEEKRIKNGGLTPTDIDFNPKFERERMSRGELKEHMEKRFDEVDKITEKKKKEHIEADPYDDK